jgi:hypothetical protein
VDLKKRNVRVRLRFPNPHGELKPGMYAEVTIYGGKQGGVLAVPREAVIREPGRDRVVVALEGGRFEPRPVPILLRDVAEVRTGPEMRRGIAELDGEVVGGIVVMRWGENALATINAVKGKLAELSKSLPEGVEIVETYDRSGLILRAVDTLREKLVEELIVVALVCAVFLFHVRSSLAIVVTLPLGILAAFIVMHWQGINANIMSLGGIAIAIGTMVDAAIVMVENLHKHMERTRVTNENRWQVVLETTLSAVWPLGCLVAAAPQARHGVHAGARRGRPSLRADHVPRPRRRQGAGAAAADRPSDRDLAGARARLRQGGTGRDGHKPGPARDDRDDDPAKERLTLVVPVTVAVIVLLLYLSFRNFADVAIILGALPLSVVDGVWLLYLLDYNLSVAVGIGFIALAGVAAETGVVMLVYLQQAYKEAWRDRKTPEGCSPRARASVRNGPGESTDPRGALRRASARRTAPSLRASGTAPSLRARCGPPARR